jgi:hypothetical protein
MKPKENNTKKRAKESLKVRNRLFILNFCSKSHKNILPFISINFWLYCLYVYLETYNSPLLMFEKTFKNIDDILHKGAGCSSEPDYVGQTSWI